jgi:prepilin-type processing-associated H-X9-DG protein
MSASPTRLSAGAVASLVLGLLPPPLSIVAWFVGLRAVRTINASDGRLAGRRLAVAGMTLGALWILVSVVGVAAILIDQLSTSRSRTACLNNLRAIGLGITAYHDLHKEQFPPGTIAATGLTPEQRLSWQTAILPYLDPKTRAGRHWEEVRKQIDSDRAWDDPANTADAQRIDRFLCPASSHVADRPAITSYIGIAGIDPKAGELPKTSPRAGFFGYDRVLGSDDIPRGLSYTMAGVESEIAPGPWAAGGTPTVRGLDPDESDYIGTRRPFGGLHSGGANVLWGDASARVVRSGILPTTFREQAVLLVPPGG